MYSHLQSQRDILRNILKLQSELQTLETAEEKYFHYNKNFSNAHLTFYKQLQKEKEKCEQASDYEFFKILNENQYEKEMAFYENVLPKHFLFKETEVFNKRKFDEDNSSVPLDWNPIKKYKCQKMNLPDLNGNDLDDTDEEILHNSLDYDEYQTEDYTFNETSKLKIGNNKEDSNVDKNVLNRVKPVKGFNKGNKIIIQKTVAPKSPILKRKNGLLKQAHIEEILEETKKDQSNDNSTVDRSKVPLLPKTKPIYISVPDLTEKKPKENIATDSGKILDTECKKILASDSEKIIEKVESANLKEIEMAANRGVRFDYCDIKPVSDKCDKVSRKRTSDLIAKPKKQPSSNKKRILSKVKTIEGQQSKKQELKIKTKSSKVLKSKCLVEEQTQLATENDLAKLKTESDGKTETPLKKICQTSSSKNIKTFVDEFDLVLKEVEAKYESSNSFLDNSSNNDSSSAQQYVNSGPSILEEIEKFIEKVGSNQNETFQLTDIPKMQMAASDSSPEIKIFKNELVKKSLNLFQSNDNTSEFTIDETTNLDSEFFNEFQQSQNQGNVKLFLNQFQTDTINVRNLCQIGVKIIDNTLSYTEKFLKKLSIGPKPPSVEITQDEMKKIQSLLSLLYEIHEVLTQSTQNLIQLNSQKFQTELADLILFVSKENKKILEKICLEQNLLRQIDLLLMNQ